MRKDSLYILREWLYSSQLQNQHIAFNRVILITVWVGVPVTFHDNTFLSSSCHDSVLSTYYQMF